MATERAGSFVYKISRLSVAGLFFIGISLTWWRDASQPEPVELVPSLTGEVEYCLSCHSDLPEISASHPVEAFGCVLCHGGERLALDADVAHSSLRGGKNPSDLAVVEQSCGGENCHSGTPANARDHIQRVMTSIQATYTGAITSVRYTFGDQANLIPQQAAAAVQDTSLPSSTGLLALEAFHSGTASNPLLQAFGQSCLTCHLNASPREGRAYSRYTGCAACHSPGSSPTPGESITGSSVHRLTTAMTYTQCNTCHNRGNYDLRSMTFVERSDLAITRIQDYYQPIAHFTQCEYTLDCVDCHTRDEVMGDGDIHAAQADIQYIQCKTCHGTTTELPKTLAQSDPLDVALRLARLNPIMELNPGDTVIVTGQGEPIWNSRVLPDGTYEMIGKVTRQRFVFNPVLGTNCKQNPTQQESRYCHECHEVKR